MRLALHVPGAIARLGLAAFVALAALPGCVGPPTVAGYGTIYAETVPADVYARPHIWYGGAYAYLVGDRWYYPASSGWVILRREPPELYRYRTTYAYRGGPAYYGRTYRQAAPPAPPPPSPYGYPPPAERVR